ncbi:MAG: hypothetical protein ACP5KG_04040 [Myxococcota bacterium]
MSFIISIVLLIVSIVLLLLYIKEKNGRLSIRIGKRGSSVIASEIPFDNDTELVEGILSYIPVINEYQIYLACSGMDERSPNKIISDREYFLGKLDSEKMKGFRLKSPFKDISIFFLNEEIEDKEKILLTHDLIVNAAQIPDRELLLESGFIVTIIASSNLIVVTGVKGEFERLLLYLFEYLSGKNKSLILSKM